MVKVEPAYGVVRHSDDGYDYLDLMTIRTSSEWTTMESEAVDNLIPHWAKANKVVRVVKLRIEIEEE